MRNLTTIRCLVMLMLLLFAVDSYGQQDRQTISGTIKDKSGTTLPGASIKLKGTSKGANADANGNYKISIPANTTNPVLIYSAIGFETQEAIIGNRTIVDVTLIETASQLNEVVVVGYGTVAKKDLTGAVSSVNGGLLNNLPVTSAAQALVGRLPGVQITQSEGSPDAEFKIRIRGGGSITQDNSPLYIVDGFPVDNINDIAPVDIASVDVLKDASSAAIYGARGANGVILITTRTGKEGTAKVNYNGYAGLRKMARPLETLNPYEYALYTYEQLGGAVYTPRLGNFQDIDMYKQIKGTNYQNEILGNTGRSIFNNFSISGGSKTSRYNLSLTRNDDQAIMLGSGLARTNLNIKTSYDAKKWLKFELNSRFSDNSVRGGGTISTTGREADTRLGHIIQFVPTRGVSDYIDVSQDDDDADLVVLSLFNPVTQTNADYRRSGQLSLNFNGATDIIFSKNLKYRFEGGAQFNNSNGQRFYGIGTSNAYQYGSQPVVQLTEGSGRTYRIANILTYNAADFIVKHGTLTALAGQEINIFRTKSLLTSAKYFPKNIDAQSALGMTNLGTADPIVTRLNPDNKLSSFFGRLNYDYKGRYLFSSTFRADGSSKFAEGNRWGYFPSAALAWRISEEKFFQSAKDYVSNLKFRVSYGQSGNNRIADDVWKKTFSITSGLLFFGNESTPTGVLIPETVLSNPGLKWETTISRNIGLDFGLFNQRLSGSIEVYKNTTRDLLISATIPRNTGYTTQVQNIGQTANRGIEITLDGVIVNSKSFKLSGSFNIGFNRNNIEKLGSAPFKQTVSWTQTNGPTEEYFIQEGGQVGAMYGYQTAGYYKIDDFDYNATTKTYTLKAGVSDNSALINDRRFGPGSLKLVNQNPEEDNIVNDKDRVIIGNSNPKHTGGFSFTAQLKGFDVSTFFNWVYGNSVYNANRLAFTSSKDFKNVLNEINSDKRWMTVDKTTGARVTDPAELAALNANATIWSAGIRAIPFHSWAVEDGSFLRFNNLTIGYSFPKGRLLTRLGVSQLRLYATGDNIWIWTKYSGYDPEVDSKRATPLTPSVDYGAYPRSRFYSFGVNLTL